MFREDSGGADYACAAQSILHACVPAEINGAFRLDVDRRVSVLRGSVVHATDECLNELLANTLISAGVVRPFGGQGDIEPDIAATGNEIHCHRTTGARIRKSV